MPTKWRRSYRDHRLCDVTSPDVFLHETARVRGEVIRRSIHQRQTLPSSVNLWTFAYESQKSVNFEEEKIKTWKVLISITIPAIFFSYRMHAIRWRFCGFKLVGFAVSEDIMGFLPLQYFLRSYSIFSKVLKVNVAGSVRKMYGSYPFIQKMSDCRFISTVLWRPNQGGHARHFLNEGIQTIHPGVKLP